jgi:glutathionylspermidine synthase
VSIAIDEYGESVSDSETVLPSYFDFVQDLYKNGVIADAWNDGHPRFRLQGVLLPQNLARALRLAAERVGAVYQELVALLWRNPGWLDSYFDLTPYQKLMWFSAQGRWHGIARADLFCCDDSRVQCCEVNSDTPSGEPEAVVLNQLLMPHHPGVQNPNRYLPTAFWRMLMASHGGRKPRSIGIIYPTELSEDLGMISIYQRWLQARGCRVVLGSPYNLHPCGDGVGMFGQRVDLIIRHYKTDWWGERQVVWRDADPYPDPEPLAAQLQLILEAEYSGRVTVVNPFGAVISQNKLSLAFMWEKLDHFSPQAQRWIRRYIPPTFRLSTRNQDDLLAQQQGWVMKSAYGCEGEETICGPFVSTAEWQESISCAIPRFWICQRFFHAASDIDGNLSNFGVFLIGGKSAGFFTRLALQATDDTAVAAPTFIEK